MTKPKQPPLDPSQVSRDAGAVTSGWWRLGEGSWYGTVVDKLGIEWEVEELPSAKSWRATSSAAQVYNASSLEQLLKKALP